MSVLTSASAVGLPSRILFTVAAACDGWSGKDDNCQAVAGADCGDAPRMRIVQLAVTPESAHRPVEPGLSLSVAVSDCRCVSDLAVCVPVSVPLVPHC